MPSTATLESNTDDHLSVIFSALAHPTRRAILGRLAEGEASVGELAEPFAMSLPAISRHIRVLEHAGLVQQHRRAQYRPCTLDATPLAAVTAWTDQVRDVWHASFDRLDDYVHQIQNQPPQKEEPS
ncbi:MAG: metalloregulator ArsR/SmtB family transcription factor [Actinomycetota bacterium]